MPHLSVLLASKRNTNELAISSSHPSDSSIPLPEYMLASLHSWRCDICHLFPWGPGQVLILWQPLQWELTTEVWVWRLALVAWARWPSPKVFLAKESTAFPVWSSVVMNLPFSLVLTARSSEDRLCIDISILLFTRWRCLHITVIGVRWTLPFVAIGAIYGHGGIGTSQISHMYSGPTGLAMSYITNNTVKVIL